MASSVLFLFLALYLLAQVSSVPYVLNPTKNDAELSKNLQEEVNSVEEATQQDPQIEFTSRRAFPEDVMGEWKLEAVVNFSCPRTITHTTWGYTPAGTIGLPHNTIQQDNSRCESEGSERQLEFFESQNYNTDLTPITDKIPPLPAGLVNMLTTTGLNIDILFSLQQFGEEYLVGYESVIRDCGENSVFQNGTTAFVARPFQGEFTIKNVDFNFKPGSKYMIMVPRYRQAYCVYEVRIDMSAEIEPEVMPSTEAVPMPSAEADMVSSPAPVPGDDAMAPEGSAKPVPSPDVVGAPTIPAPSSDVVPGENLPGATDSEQPETSTEESPSASVEESTTPSSTDNASSEDDGPACFPASAKVTLDTGASIPIDALSVGDRVLVGRDAYSTVHAFTHQDYNRRWTFYQLTLASGARLRATAGHFIPTADGRTITAAKLEIGDYLFAANGVASQIVGKEVVQDVGLFNPQTATGMIVVDGVVATTYTTAVPPAMAHSLLAPLRALFATCGVDPLPRLLSATGMSRFVQYM